MGKKRCRLDNLDGELQTAGQRTDAAGDVHLLPAEYTTNPKKAQTDVIAPMLSLARRRGDWEIWASLVGLALEWEARQ